MLFKVLMESLMSCLVRVAQQRMAVLRKKYKVTTTPLVEVLS